MEDLDDDDDEELEVDDDAYWYKQSDGHTKHDPTDETDQYWQEFWKTLHITAATPAMEWQVGCPHGCARIARILPRVTAM